MSSTLPVRKSDALQERRPTQAGGGRVAKHAAYCASQRPSATQSSHPSPCRHTHTFFRASCHWSKGRHSTLQQQCRRRKRERAAGYRGHHAGGQTCSPLTPSTACTQGGRHAETPPRLACTAGRLLCGTEHIRGPPAAPSPATRPASAAQRNAASQAWRFAAEIGRLLRCRCC